MVLVPKHMGSTCAARAFVGIVVLGIISGNYFPLIHTFPPCISPLLPGCPRLHKQLPRARAHHIKRNNMRITAKICRPPAVLSSKLGGYAIKAE